MHPIHETSKTLNEDADDLETQSPDIEIIKVPQELDLNIPEPQEKNQTTILVNNLECPKNAPNITYFGKSYSGTPWGKQSCT